MMTSTSVTFEALTREGKGTGVYLNLCPQNNTDIPLETVLKVISPTEAKLFGEACLQVTEGFRYEYELSDFRYRLEIESSWSNTNDLLIQSKLSGRQHCGILNPGLSTGTIKLSVISLSNESVGFIDIEIRSRKLGYRADYQEMLSDITNQCIELIQDWKSASKFKAAPEIGKDASTIGQQFSFIKSLLSNATFEQALHRVIFQPYEKWEKSYINQPTTHGFRSNSRIQRQLTKGGRRIIVPSEHSLSFFLPSLPEQLSISESKRSTDTPENRFVKFALESFHNFLDDMSRKSVLKEDRFKKLLSEIDSLSQKLEEVLSADLFRKLSRLEVLPLGSPTLQRREGYREVMQAWMNFSLAAKISWSGGDQVYGMGQRDVATLYEYWVFFSLLKITSEIFNLTPPDINELISSTDDGFSLQLKAGRHQAIRGSCAIYGRKLSISFSYNRSFRHSKDFQRSGSWTQAMRPDYTVSLWPEEYSEEEAEAQELMVHVHFDAKYRLEQITELLWNKESDSHAEIVDHDLDEVKKAEARGTYKRADLLKMHAYRDAIRRSHGAYVIYPGNSNDGEPFKAFHEILPGLGAFALRPGAGTETLERFLRDIVRHVSDRTTARERQSFQTYKSYLNTPPQVAEEQRPAYSLLPEQLAGDRHMPPIDTYVLVGWYKNEAHLEWIHSKGKYNFRLGPTEGGLRLSPQVVGAHYLLLYGGPNGSARKGLFRIKSSQDGPEFINKAGLEALGYPTPPTRDSYAVFDVEIAQEFAGFEWKLTNLKQFPDGDKLGHPFATTLADLFGTLGRNQSNS